MNKPASELIALADDIQVVGVAQQAIMKHPFFEGGATLAFGLARTALLAAANALATPPAQPAPAATHGKPDGAVQEALVRLENACEAQRQSYRDHPEYSEGFYDAQCGDPLFDDATDPYRAGWEAFYVCKEIMDHNGFSRTADGSFEKSFTIGRALQQSQSQSQEGK